MKNKQAITLLLIANTISGFAQGLTMLAIPWYFADKLDAVSLFGKIYLLTTFLSLFWGTYAGTLVDKYNRKKMFLWQSIAGFLVLGGTAIYGFANQNVPVSLIAVCFIATVFVYNIHYPNLYAFAQEITEPENYGRINSILEIQGQATSMIAGAIGTILIGTKIFDSFTLFGNEIILPFSISPIPIYKVFAIDAFTYLLAFFIILLIKYLPKTKTKIETGGVIEQVKIGFKFLFENPIIFIYGICSYAIFATILVGNFYIAPNYISDVLKETGDVFASIEMTFAIGALLAGFFIRIIFKNVSNVIAILIMTILVAIFYIYCSIKPTVLFFIIGYLIVGLCNAGARILRVTYLFEKVPNQIIGRTSSAFRIVNIFVRMILISLFGLSFFVSNLKMTYLVMAVLLLMAMFGLVYIIRPIKELRVKTEY